MEFILLVLAIVGMPVLAAAAMATASEAKRGAEAARDKATELQREIAWLRGELARRDEHPGNTAGTPAAASTPAPARAASFHGPKPAPQTATQAPATKAPQSAEASGASQSLTAPAIAPGADLRGWKAAPVQPPAREPAWGPSLLAHFRPNRRRRRCGRSRCSRREGLRESFVPQLLSGLPIE